MRVAIAQLNQRVGDLEANTRALRDAIQNCAPWRCPTSS